MMTMNKKKRNLSILERKIHCLKLAMPVISKPPAPVQNSTSSQEDKPTFCINNVNG
jgi:hypothetical protein